eukprot:722771-Prymnesium_polylepis.1
MEAIRANCPACCGMPSPSPPANQPSLPPPPPTSSPPWDCDWEIASSGFYDAMGLTCASWRGWP